MTVKELKELLESKDYKDYDKVEVVTSLEKTANKYSVTYSPIDSVRQVMVGVGVYIVGIVVKS